MSIPAGTMIGHYRIERPIGSGGFATVYLANDDRLDATVAVKVLAENRALDVEARRRFVEEARKLRMVESSSVVTVYDVGETSSHQPYMVLEHADRGDLAARRAYLRRRATVDECREIVAFLHAALGALHRVGLVHRDVKPHNVLIRTDSGQPEAPGPLVAANERLLLGDLGFVKDLNLASGLTVGGGTWAYQAPEQQFRLGTVDRRADIYSATTVIAWLLTGGSLVEGQQWSDLLDRAALQPALRLELLRGMAPTPDERHPTIDHWRAALDAALRSSSPELIRTEIMPGSAPSTNTKVMPPTAPPRAPAKTPSMVTSTKAPESRDTGRRFAMFGLGALTLIGVGFAGGVLVRSGGGLDQQISPDGEILTTEADVGGFRVSISGPVEITVGEPATFISELPDGVSASWIYPDGRVTPSGFGVVYTADTEGSFTVSLLVVPPDSAPELVVHRARAVP